VSKRVGKYLAQHKSKCAGRRVPVSYALLKSAGTDAQGLVVEAKYTTKGRGKEPPTTRLYYFLILNPFFKGYCHAISLEHMPVQIFEKIAMKSGIVKSPIGEVRKLPSNKIALDASSKGFYMSDVKAKAKTAFNDSYRKLLPEGFGQTQLVNYEFSKAVTDKWLKGKISADELAKKEKELAKVKEGPIQKKVRAEKGEPSPEATGKKGKKIQSQVMENPGDKK
tara:strand:- start:230 stop:898 length:669 start_codon:yes stop_codon:yes gene_type:complete